MEGVKFRVAVTDHVVKFLMEPTKSCKAKVKAYSKTGHARCRQLCFAGIIRTDSTFASFAIHSYTKTSLPKILLLCDMKCDMTYYHK